MNLRRAPPRIKAFSSCVSRPSCVFSRQMAVFRGSPGIQTIGKRVGQLVAAWSLRACTAVVVLLACLAAPRAAQAGCGDYVLIGGRHRPIRHLAPTAASDSADLQNGGLSRDADERTPARAPCHGPGCSQRSLPPAAPASEIQLPVERWAIGRAGQAPPSLSISRLLVSRSELPADGFVPTILRPPR